MVETTFRSGGMNERIDELMIEAGARFEFLHGVHYDDFQYKKFAELIVQECARLNRLHAYELLGVIADVEQGDGFDHVCLTTVKRVAQYLSNDLKQHFEEE